MRVKAKPTEEQSEPPLRERKPYVLKRAVNPRRLPWYIRWRNLFYLVVLLGIVSGIILYVYYQRYSAIIDSGLQGKIFERSSGIYAAPMTVRAGENRRMGDLIRHLQGVGYVQRGATETGTHGHYAVNGNAIELFPSPEAVIDGAKLFQPLRVEYGPNGNGIQSITATETRQSLLAAQIEPEQISATLNEQREKRKIIKYEDLPHELVVAIVAIEDRGFFQHSGISFRGILRALFRNYEAGEIREGGSTITQQLVKSFFLTPEKTPKRKLSEAYMAIILERKLTKMQIFEMYCNQIYLGQRGGFSVNGFGEAARAYFGKDIRQLRPHESALLAGIIHSPNYYSLRQYKDTNPLLEPHEKRALDRRNTVLELMVAASNEVPRSKDDPRPKEFTEAEAQAAKLQPLGVIDSGGTNASDAPYFMDYVMRQLEAQFGEDTQSMRSMRTYTTVDLGLQRAAYDAVRSRMPEIDALVAQRRGTGTRGLQVALVAMDAKNGDVLAMIGGRDYALSQLNRATDARRQPGSVFKPFVYAAALGSGDPERRVTTAMIFKDEPRSFEFDGRFYSPGNFGDTYENRSMTVREALVKSKNVIAVSVAERVGFQQVAGFAQQAGLTNVPAVPSVALGAAEATPLQMASAYTAFANQGRRSAPVAIRRITTKDGATIHDASAQASDVMSPQVAFLMTSMMQDVLDYGTGTRVRQLGFRDIAAGKTGSSRDGWFAGYTRELVCVVWIGFDDNTDIGVTGGSTAALIWGDFMIRAMQLRPDLGGAFESPREGLVTLYIDPVTGQPAQTDTPGARAELFLSGTETGDAQPYLPAQPIPVNPSGPSGTVPEAISPSTDSLGAVTADVSPPLDNRGISDVYIPVPPEARGTVSLSGAAPVQPAPVPILSAGSGASSAPRPVVTPVPIRTAQTRPRPVGTATPAPRAVPANSRIKVTAGAMPGPTPWPTPPPASSARGTAARQASNTDPNVNVIVIGGRTSSGRPRIVPTPTPVLKSKAGRTSPPPKSTSQKATSKPTLTAANKSNAAKPATPKPAPTQLAKATKPAPKPSLGPSPQATQATVQATPAPPLKPVAAPAPIKAAASSGRTFTLEVCSVSKLIPVKGICKTTERKTFQAGQEPKRQCSADRHGGN
jgi:penicillin-binding protein 1B